MGLGSGIRDPGFGIRKKPIPDPGSRGKKGAGSQIRIRNTSFDIKIFRFLLQLILRVHLRLQLGRPHSCLLRLRFPLGDLRSCCLRFLYRKISARICRRYRRRRSVSSSCQRSVTVYGKSEQYSSKNVLSN
jgi:hypothetical protein